jgi:hypothetical protein
MKKYFSLTFSAVAVVSLSLAAAERADLPVVLVPPLQVTAPDSLPKLPPLSGITVFPNKSTGTFTLEFSQELEESAVVKVTNAKKKVVYTNSLAPQPSNFSKTLDMGKLASGTYLVEVKMANMTYWKELKISGKNRKK